MWRTEDPLPGAARKVEKNFEERVQEGVKPLRGKRVGSAQSARRIQPGGGSGRAGGPADLSRPPFLPTRPLHPSSLPGRPPSSSSSSSSSSPERAVVGGRRRAPAGAGVGGRGRGWGRRGTAPRPATGRRRAHFHRGGAPRPAPGRLGRPGGEGGSGGPRLPSASAAVASAGPPPECYSPPGSSARRIPGPRERDPSPRSPPSRRPPPRGPSARGSPPAGARRRPRWGAGPPLPRRDRSPTPSPPLPPGDGRGGVSARRGRGGLSPVRPGRVAPSGPGGRFSRATRASPEEGDGGASARGRRRCRLPTRPVLKHGPRSLTRARVGGSHESRRGAMKVKAGALAGRGGIPRPLQSAEGAPPARLARRAGEVEHERTC
uniref:collagen alpha-1(III) chain-like n=1 Tax=Callithrix jacchus TaxID=9483 RepID=UPI0023DD5FEE|nr:collagen alpha-1(III) chain-like [Callithrix jacchus]